MMDAEKMCKTCGFGMRRDPYIISRNGWYNCQFECTNLKHEKAPYKRAEDTCELWCQKGKEKL